MKKSLVCKRMIALFLAIIISFSGLGIGVTSANAEGEASNTVTLKLTGGYVRTAYYGYAKDSEGNDITKDSEGNTIDKAIQFSEPVDENHLFQKGLKDYQLGNTTGSSSLSSIIYMDWGTAVTFSIVSEKADKFKLYLSDSTGKIIGNSNSVISNGTVQNGSDTNFQVLLDNDKNITIFADENHRTAYVDYYFTLAETNGKVTIIFPVRIMTKTTDISISNPRPALKAGNSSQLTAIPEIDGTDGFQWTVSTGGGEVAPQKSDGYTRDDTRVGIYSSNKEGQGTYTISVKTMSGINPSDLNTQCIAIQSRGESDETSVILSEYIPAKTVSFKEKEYSMIVGNSLNLETIINATSETYAVNDSSKLLDPNDTWEFSSSDPTVASITTDGSVSTLKALKSGDTKISVYSKETPTTSNASEEYCTIHVKVPTESLTVTCNDEVIAKVSASENIYNRITKVRSGNELTVYVEESSQQCDEDVVVVSKYKGNENGVWEYENDDIKIEKNQDEGYKKKYVISAGDVTEKKGILLKVSTDRSNATEGNTAELSTYFELDIYPKYADDESLKSLVTFDNVEFEADEDRKSVV